MNGTNKVLVWANGRAVTRAVSAPSVCHQGCLGTFGLSPGLSRHLRSVTRAVSTPSVSHQGCLGTFGLSPGLSRSVTRAVSALKIQHLNFIFANGRGGGRGVRESFCDSQCQGTACTRDQVDVGSNPIRAASSTTSSPLSQNGGLSANCSSDEIKEWSPVCYKAARLKEPATAFSFFFFS